jgi:hypothetical protein
MGKAKKEIAWIHDQSLSPLYLLLADAVQPASFETSVSDCYYRIESSHAVSPCMEEEITEGKLFGTFDKYDEFLTIQKALLAIDLAAEPDNDEDVKESDLFRRLCNIVSSIVFSHLCQYLLQACKAR